MVINVLIKFCYRDKFCKHRNGIAAILRVTSNFCIRGKDVAGSRTLVAALKIKSCNRDVGGIDRENQKIRL